MNNSENQYDGLQVVPNNNMPDKQAYGVYPQSSYQGTTVTSSYIGEDAAPNPEKRIAGMRRSTLVLTSTVVLLLIVIALIGGLFGSKIGSLEDKFKQVQTPTP